MSTHTKHWRKWALSALILPTPAFGQLQSSDVAAYWPFDNDLVDASGNGGDGTFQTDGATGSPTFTSGGVAANQAKFGEAVSLVAANDQSVLIDGAGNASFQGEDAYDFTGGSMTVSAWFSNTGGFLNTWQGLIVKGEGNSWRVGRNNSDLFLNFAAGTGNTGAASTSDLSSGLHHFVAVSDANLGNFLYINGVLEGFLPGTPNIEDSTSFLTIGDNPQQSNREGNNTFDDVILFNRALTAPEAVLLYNSGNGIIGSDIVAGIDSEPDGIPDYYEIANGLNVGVDDSLDDRDGDDINNITEYLNGYGANNPDSDGDGLEDGEELANNADPLIRDTDGDGLTDGEEVLTHMTEPDDTDSDDDQASDFDEVSAGSDPNSNTSVPSPWNIGLVSYWKFDDDLTSSTNLGAEGTYRTDDGMAPTYTAGKFGNAIDLNSTQNEFIEIVDTTEIPENTFDFTMGSMAVSVWFTTGTGFTEDWQALIAKGEGSSWRIARNARSSGMSANPGDWQGGGDNIFGNTSIDDTMIHHLVLTVDHTEGGTAQLWIDGLKVFETNAPPVINDSLSNLLIGANPDIDSKRTWNGQIDDIAIWSRPLSQSEIGQIWARGDGRSIQSLIDDPDTDGDGMPDSYEITNMLNRLVKDGDDDADMDNVSNLQEFMDGTNPQEPDSDDDGLNEGEEKANMTDPLDRDTDKDTLADGDEVNNLGTFPLLADSDGDGFSDIVEIDFGTLPRDDTSFPSLDAGLIGYWPLDIDLEDDTDGNGNGTWYQNGTTGEDPVFTIGKYGNAISLDHSQNQYVLVDGAGGATPRDYTQAGDSISVSVWTSFTTFTENWQGLVARGEGNAWRLHGRGPVTDDGLISFAGGGQQIIGDQNYNDGQFHHIVAISEKGMNNRIYVDGVLVVTSAEAPTLTANNNPGGFIAIGGNPDATVRSWNGIIDEVAIWGRPLSDAEIMALATASNSLGEQLGLGEPPTDVRVVQSILAGGTFFLAAENLNPNVRYTLRRSIDLTPGSFQPVGDVITGVSEATFEHDAASGDKAFYQIWTAAPETP